MPWQASEASGFTKKADTPKKKRLWAHTANSVLKQTGSEAKAVKAANAACAREKEDSMDDRRRRRKGQSRDPQGRELETWEELEEYDSSPLAIIVDASPSSLRMYDAIAFDDDANLQITRDGYLKAQPRIARTGIQLYKGDECGRDDVDFVRVYRPESSVFHNDATHSYTHLPITIEHPGQIVTADNWKKYAVGETGDEVLRDGGSVRVPMMLRDAKAIELVKSGKRELSVGYGCELDWAPGITPDGEPYDAVQHNIRGNHLAIVSHARGGSTLRIGDSDMELKTVLIDGLPCQMSDKDAAIVTKTITKLQDENEFFKKKFAKKEEEEEEEKAEDAKRVEEGKTKDAMILTLQQQLKDATDPGKLDAQLADRDLVRNKARTVMGTAFKVDGRKIEDVRREVVLAKSGVPSAKDWGDAEIKAVFDHLTSDVRQRDPITDARTAFAGGNDAMQNPKAAAYMEMVKDMENAWRSPS